ncbi:MAG TPA: hypothetical protein VGO07_01430 [Candidatus Saccharimonadales bacterium]|jgi:hypothetical protein|nr:hypothetical protein [Candidatus Saccharimonadales bacterium]
MSLDNQLDIRTKDLIAMAVLKTKYWDIFWDIEKNKDLYTQIRLEDRRASVLMMDDDDEQKYRKQHFDSLFGELGYSSEDIQSVQSILNDTFPGWRDKHASDDEDTMRAENRIGHRDVLDLYFSYGTSQELFKKRLEQVRRITDHAGKDSEKTLMRKLREFTSYVTSDEEPGSIARLFARRLLRTQSNKNNQLLIWRHWLRAYLQYGAGANDGTNSVIASILSGANDAIQRSAPVGSSSQARIDQHRIELARWLFEDITSYLKDPYPGLLMLLFMLPARGNRFFEEYMNNGGLVEVFEIVLGYTDGYFLNPVKKRNIFQEYEWPYWSFVLYQWSLSIDASNGNFNKLVPSAHVRHRKVNDYVFSLLDGDPRLTYQFVREQFWSNEGWSSETYEWRIASKIAQYNNPDDISSLLDVVEKAMNGARLSRSQKEELQEFHRLLSQFGERSTSQ